MSRSCPIYGKAIYLDCQDCINKVCKMKYKTIVIGIDQSYNRTGVSISADGKLLKVKSIDFAKYRYKNNTQKRNKIRAYFIENLLVQTKIQTNFMY